MKHFPFQVFTLSIFLILILPLLVQDGMFMDGVLYAAVAKNQATGFGSFWFPIFADTWNKHGVHTFHEHPPLVFGLQSLFFRVLGTSIYVERFYSFLTAILTAWLIHLNWKIIVKNQPKYIGFSWLAILFWIITPVCFWSFQNNMQENTMGIFTLASTYFSLKYYFQKTDFQNLIYSGFFIFLASFSKGVPGIFPLGVPFIIWISTQKINFVKVIHHTSLLTFTTFGIYALLMLHEPARESLTFYFESRLMGRVSSDPTVNNRFYTIGRLVQELLPALILAALILLFLKKKNGNLLFPKEHLKKVGLIFLIGFSGTLPLMLTMVQKGFYMVHALPYFGIAIALLVVPSFSIFYKKINTAHSSFYIFKNISILLLVGSIVFSVLQIGKIKRDDDMLHDVYLLKNVLPKKAHISLEKAIQQDWNLKVYLMRNSEISTDHHPTHPFFLTEKNKPTPKDFRKKMVHLKRYELFKIIE